MKRGALAIKRPARFGSFSKIPWGNFTKRPESSGTFTIIANHLYLCYSFVIISCLREFLLFLKAVDVNPGLFRTNQTWFDINGGMISKNEFNEVY